MKSKGRYRVEEIYEGSFWRIRSPEGKWLHHAHLALPRSFVREEEAEALCRELNAQREAEVAA